MAMDIRNFTQMHKAWFPNTPINAKKATGTLTFSGVVSDGQTVTIGSEVYEFKTSGSASGTNIKVDMSGGVTASQAVTALVLAITNNSSIVTAVDGAGDTVVVSYAIVGTDGNDIGVSETCTNGTWGLGVTKLSGGQYCTPCACPRAFIVISGIFYYASEPCDKYSSNWYSITPVLVT